MRAILPIILYVAACFCIAISLDFIYAAVLIGLVSAVFAYEIFSKYHSNTERIKYYIKIREHLLLTKKYNESPYICWILKRDMAFPDWFKTEVIKTMKDLSYTHPRLIDPEYVLVYGLDSTELIESTYGVWFLKDYDSRIEFVDTMISELKQGIKANKRYKRI